MNGDGPFGVPRPEKITAEIVPGNTLKEIEDSLSTYDFSSMQKLMMIFGCSIGELPHKIARAKGIKNADNVQRISQNIGKVKNTNRDLQQEIIFTDRK